ncbi:MAG: TIGR03915 family putative DNA repair protein [Clostridia bacterium]|nr:TIGR03915 family putative DNA repair protein [Clostridia bacterium]
MIYLYDGSFEGLLTAIFEAYYRKENPEKILRNKALQQTLFEEYIHIPTDEIKADKVYDSIRSKISHQALQHAYYTYLSDFEDAGTWIYRYLQLGWKMGHKVDYHLADDRVLTVHNTSRKVFGESHLLLGLVRFKKLSSDLFYAPIEPAHNIVSLIAPHFSSRLADQNWIIHDVKRNMAALYNKVEWVITELDANPNLTVDEEEQAYQGLWKQYFESIAIRSRVNPDLQKRHMPRRYWKYLTEKQML